MSTQKQQIRPFKEVDRLVNDNIRLAYFFANKYKFYCGQNESLSFAMEGLLIAARTWNPADGAFGTWAGNRIKWVFSREKQRQIAVKRGGPGASGLREWVKHTSLDAPAGDPNDKTFLVGEVIPDEHALAPGEDLREFERINGNDAEVRRLLGMLSKRDAEIMRLRYGLHGRKEMILEEIGQKFGLTRERVRQIEAGALRKFWREKRRKKLEPVVVPAEFVKVA